MNKEIWAACIGEELPCKRERGNPHDPFAVAVCKEANTVGHHNFFRLLHVFR